jgi:hypothetical protein
MHDIQPNCPAPWYCLGPNCLEWDDFGTLRLTAIRPVWPVFNEKAMSPVARGYCRFGGRVGLIVTQSARGQFPDVLLWMARQPQHDVTQAGTRFHLQLVADDGQ